MSEAYAMEILHRHFGATQVTTEMNIVYYGRGWKKCDFLTCLPVKIEPERVGVSVTRALLNPKIHPDDIDAGLSRLLDKKLHGLVISRAGTDEQQSFYYSLLFVWSPDRVSSRLFESLFHQADPSLTEGVILVIVEANETSLRRDFVDNKKVETNIVCVTTTRETHTKPDVLDDDELLCTP